MWSGTNLPVVDQAGAATVATNLLLGMFKGLSLDLKSDKLYDLDGVIPDVIGLRAVVKVMSVPDSRCIRVVVPDDHVPNKFHEILIHDMDRGTPFCGLE